MPIYEFRCCGCGQRFEAYCGVTGQGEDLKCPHCGKPELERVWSTFSTRVGGGGPTPAGKSCSRFT